MVCSHRASSLCSVLLLIRSCSVVHVVIPGRIGDHELTDLPRSNLQNTCFPTRKRKVRINSSNSSYYDTPALRIQVRLFTMICPSVVVEAGHQGLCRARKVILMVEMIISRGRETKQTWSVVGSDRQNVSPKKTIMTAREH